MISQYLRGDCDHCTKRGHCVRQNDLYAGTCAYKFGEPKQKYSYRKVPIGNPCVEGFGLGNGLRVKPLAIEHVKGCALVGDGGKRKWKPK